MAFKNKQLEQLIGAIVGTHGHSGSVRFLGNMEKPAAFRALLLKKTTKVRTIELVCLCRR